MMVLIGYLFDARDISRAPGQFSGLAANASIAFLALGVGILFTNLPTGLLRSLASPYLGGMMLRRMLPVVVVLIIGIVWLRLTVQSTGLLDANVASGTVAIILAVEGILIWNAGVLDQLDKVRRRGDEQIRQLNATLNSRVLALEAANREFQGFSYSMSHVLRAPLRTIHGFAQIVLDDLGEKLGTEGRRLLGVMQTSTEEMSELLDGILAFLRLGWQPMTIAPVDMQQLVRTVIEQLESKTTGRTIRFAVGELPDALGDASMIERVWLNLLDNAVKFTACRDEATIEVGAQVGNDQTIYFVKDDGAGFDMQYVAKLFGVFQRLHDLTQFPGTGIGLAIVNRIVARHGGRVWAEGKPGEGATVLFQFTSSGENPCLSSPETVHILLVEDNPADAELCIRALRKHNLANELVWVKDGAEALDFLFHTGAYADGAENDALKVILLDLRLPKVDGLEVLRRIRADERTMKIPVVVLTSSQEDPDVTESYSIGANSFISKPVNFGNFSDTVEKLGLYWLLINRTCPTR